MGLTRMLRRILHNDRVTAIRLHVVAIGNGPATSATKTAPMTFDQQQIYYDVYSFTDNIPMASKAAHFYLTSNTNNIKYIFMIP